MARRIFSEEVILEWREYFTILLCWCVLPPLLDGDRALLCYPRGSTVPSLGRVLGRHAWNEWMNEWMHRRISGGDGPTILCSVHMHVELWAQNQGGGFLPRAPLLVTYKWIGDQRSEGAHSTAQQAAGQSCPEKPAQQSSTEASSSSLTLALLHTLWPWASYQTLWVRF